MRLFTKIISLVYRKDKVMKTYTFDVNFEIKIGAMNYDEAVRKADKLLPDNNGKTTFIVNTEEYGFWPNQETLDNMHDWNECSCHQKEPTIEEIENLQNNNLVKEIEEYLDNEDFSECNVCGTHNNNSHDPHCPVPDGDEIERLFGDKS